MVHPLGRELTPIADGDGQVLGQIEHDGIGCIVPVPPSEAHADGVLQPFHPESGCGPRLVSDERGRPRYGSGAPHLPGDPHHLQVALATGSGPQRVADGETKANADAKLHLPIVPVPRTSCTSGCRVPVGPGRRAWPSDGCTPANVLWHAAARSCSSAGRSSAGLSSAGRSSAGLSGVAQSAERAAVNR